MKDKRINPNVQYSKIGLEKQAERTTQIVGQSARKTAVNSLQLFIEPASDTISIRKRSVDDELLNETQTRAQIFDEHNF